MIPRPAYLGEPYASRFQDQSVVDRYHLRPPYPPETIKMLSELIQDEPRTVLDVGCGTGDIARPLAEYVERIDAVDLSSPMLERARTLPGGHSHKIRWFQGKAELVETNPPYTLITAGQSLHWMDWGVILPRFTQILTPQGVLAVVHTEDRYVPWYDGYLQIVQRFTNNPAYVPVEIISLFEQYHLFHTLGKLQTAPVPFQQTVEDFIAAQHARSSLSLETMTIEQAEAFNTEMQALLSPFAQDGVLTFDVIGHITWGKPLSGQQ